MERENTGAAKKYWAFISYSSKDKKWGQWLHKGLERYPIPKELQGARLFDGAILGKNLSPIFRDRDELSGSADLGPALEKALRQSRYLVVLCSKNSATSTWVDKEIEDFKAMGGEKNILALILDGEPNAGGSEECFPPALRYPAEPLAGDLRKDGDGKERGLLKIVAGAAQLDFDVLYRRHERAQRKKRYLLGIAALLLIATLSALSIFALSQKKEALKQASIALTQKKEALKQTSIAVTQRTQAQLSAAEALKQRDNAKRTLSDFYDERAEVSFKQDPDKSLAWSVKAAEINPEILKKPRFTTRNREIIGQWPTPDLVIPSHRSSDQFVNMTGREDWGISIEHQRAAVISGRSKATLLDTGKMERLLEIEFTQTIDQIITPTNADWFALAGMGQFRVYSWSEGSLLYQGGKTGNSGSFKAHQGLITRVYRDLKSRETLTSIIYRNGGEIIEQAGPPLPSWNPNCFAVKRENGFCFFTIEESSDSADKSNLGIHLYLNDKVKWERLSSKLPADFQAANMWYETAAQALVLVHKDKPTIAVIDLLHPQIYHLNLTDASRVHGILRDEKKLELVRKKSKDNGSGMEAINVDDLSSRDLLGGRDLSSFFLAPQSGIIMGWERDSETFFFEGANQLKGSFQLPTLSKNYWYLGDACRMTEIAPNVIGIFTHNLGGQSVNLVDLSQPDQPEVFTGTVAHPFAFTSVEKKDNAWFVSVLTHKGKALSQFSKLSPVSLSKTNKQAFQSAPKFEMGWHAVDDDGQTRSWVHHENETIFYTDGNQAETHHKLDEGNVAWSRKETRILENGNLVRCLYRSVQIFRPDGNLKFEAKGRNASFYGEDGKRAVIVTKEGLEIIDCLKGEVLNLIKTEDRTERIFNLSGSDDLFWISAKTLQWLGQPYEAFYLSRWSPDSPTRDFLFTNSNIELINSLSRIELSKGDSVFLARSTFTTKGAKSATIQVLTDSGLAHSLHLKFDDRQPDLMKLWSFLSDGSIVSRKSGPASSASQLSHHRFKDGEWTSSDISLPSPLINIIRSPDGAHCLLACQDGLLFYDTLKGELNSTYLKVTEREVNFTSDPTVGWTPRGDIMYITQHGVLYEFSQVTGEYIHLLPGHTRSTHDITKIVSSPNGQWLSTTDRGGGVITTRVLNAQLTLEELRRSANLVGGLRVINEHDLVPWPPVTKE